MTKKHKHILICFSHLCKKMCYKASELSDVLGIRETRTKALLRSLVEDGILVDNGAIKGRRYKKK